jgi:hypothetical protein
VLQGCAKGRWTPSDRRRASVALAPPMAKQDLVLDAIVDTRKKYVPNILKVREQASQPE